MKQSVNECRHPEQQIGEPHIGMALVLAFPSLLGQGLARASPPRHGAYGSPIMMTGIPRISICNLFLCLLYKALLRRKKAVVVIVRCAKIRQYVSFLDTYLFSLRSSGLCALNH